MEKQLLRILESRSPICTIPKTSRCWWRWTRPTSSFTGGGGAGNPGGGGNAGGGNASGYGNGGGGSRSFPTGSGSGSDGACGSK